MEKKDRKAENLKEKNLAKKNGKKKNLLQKVRLILSPKNFCKNYIYTEVEDEIENEEK